MDEAKNSELFYMVSAPGYFQGANPGISTPVGGDIRLHPNGSLLITDGTSHRVRFYSQEGKFLSAFGEKGSRPGQFYYPGKPYCANDGSIFIADSWNHRIQHFDENGEFLREFGKYGDGEGEFDEPYGIAVGRNGWIYVLDRCNHRVQVLDQDFRYIGSFGGRGTKLDEDMAYLCSRVEEEFTLPVFEFPSSIDIDSRGHLYVTDCNNHRMQKFDPNGAMLAQWGQKGSSKGEFMFPQSIAIDEKDNIFVVDMNNKRIQRFKSSGEFIHYISMPDDSDDSLMVPLSMACGKGKLFVGLAFSPGILIFEYQISVPASIGASKQINKNAKDQDANQDYMISTISVACRRIKNKFTLNECMELAERLGEAADSMLAEIEESRKEWVELSPLLASAWNERESSFIEGVVLDSDFFVSLHKLEKRNLELEGEQKARLTRFKRVHENLGIISSDILSHCDKASLSSIAPFIASLLDRTNRLSFYMAGLLSMHGEVFENLKEAHESFSNEKREGRVEIKYFSHFMSGTHIVLGQMNLVLGILLGTIKNMVVFLKKNETGDMERGNFFQRVFLGGIGKNLETILSKAGYDWGIYESIANSVQQLARAFHSSGVDSSFLIQTSFAGLFAAQSGKEWGALSPLMVNCFIEDLGDKGASVSMFHYHDNAIPKSGEYIQAATFVLSQCAEAGKDVVKQVIFIIKTCMEILQKKSDVEIILKSSATSDEKNRVLQEDLLFLNDFQEKLQARKAAELFLRLKSDLGLLFPILFFLRKAEGKKIEEIFPALEESIGIYRDFFHELNKLQEEKQEELKQLIRERASKEGALLNNEAMMNLEKREKVISGIKGVVEYLQKQVADVMDLHDRLNKLALGFMNAKSPAKSSNKEIQMEPDLLFGAFGFLFGNLRSPVALESNNEGHLEICSFAGHSIKKFSMEGAPMAEMGGFGDMPLKFKNPISIAFDSEGNAFVLEFATLSGAFNNRIQKISPSHEYILAIRGGGENELKRPTDFIIDIRQRLWIPDTERDQLLVYSLDGHFQFALGKKGVGPGEFQGIWGITQLDNGDIAVSETINRRIQILDSEGKHKTYCGLEGIEIGSIYKLAPGPEGFLFASDFNKHRVYIFDEKHRLTSWFGGFGRGIGKFNGPAGVKLRQGNIFVCDYFNNRIQRFKMDGVPEKNKT